MARRRQRFIRPAPRTKMWIGAGVGLQTLTGNTATLISTLSAGALLLRPFTILRSHIWLWMATDQEASDETHVASFGKIIVTDTAAAAGVGSIPNPSGISGNPEADWYVWQAMGGRFVIDSAAGFNGASGWRYVVDSKAMRKVGPDDDLATVVDMETSPGAFLISNGRTLIQLH